MKIGFIDEVPGQAHLGFDTEASDDYLDIVWVSPGEFEMLTEVDSEQPAMAPHRYSVARAAIKVADHVIGYVEAKHDTSGFDKADIARI